jgi:hypothetical protein
MRRYHICPPHYRPDDELFKKALRVCGPVLRDCLYCWQKKSTKHAMEAIKEAVDSFNVDLSDYRYQSLEGGITISSLSNLTLLLPNNNRSMTFSKLSKYADDLLLHKIANSPYWYSKTLNLKINRLINMPEAGSIEGMMWEGFIHHTIASSGYVQLHLLNDPYCSNYSSHYAPAITFASVVPLSAVGFFDITQKDLQMSSDCMYKRSLPKGYYRLEFERQAAADGVTIISDRSGVQRVVFFQFTAPYGYRASEAGMNAIKDKFEELGLDELIPYNSPSRGDQPDPTVRRDWIFVWVLPETERNNLRFQPRVFSTSDSDKWMDRNIKQYKYFTDTRDFSRREYEHELFSFRHSFSDICTPLCQNMVRAYEILARRTTFTPNPMLMTSVVSPFSAFYHNAFR